MYADSRDCVGGSHPHPSGHGATVGLPTVLPQLCLGQSSTSSPSPSVSAPSPSPLLSLPPSLSLYHLPLISPDDTVFSLSPVPSNISLSSRTPGNSILDLIHKPTCHSAQVVSAKWACV